MSISRRTFLAGTGIVGLAGGLTGCRSEVEKLLFWYWSGALSDGVVKSVAASLSRRAEITPALIPGDFKQHLTTALALRTGAPDISGVKGEDMASFLASQADRFLDLNSLGAKEISSSFATAKYEQATTRDGRQLGLPIDIGPTVLFLRTDLWGKAGLPTSPAGVQSLTSTWDGWFEAARRLKKALPGSFAIRGSYDVFATALAQQPETFITRAGTFAGDRGGVKLAWDLAVRSITEGLQASIYDGPAFGAALSSGTLTGHIGPAWNGLDIESGAPRTSGAWRVSACPGGPGDIGGSFLTVPSNSRDPQVAFSFIRQVLTPANEARSFVDASILPAVTAAYDLPELTRGSPFYGGQSTIEVLGPAARNLPRVYDSPLNTAVSASYYTELANVEGGKKPARAWADAVSVAAEVARTAT